MQATRFRPLRDWMSLPQFWTELTSSHLTRLVASLAVVGLSILHSSCVFSREDVNEPLDVRIVQELIPGQTTARQVVERMGAPTEVVQLGRRTAYRYDCSTEKVTMLLLVVINLETIDKRSDRIWVFFDDRDILTHYGKWFGTHRTQYAMPWEDVHEPEDNAAKDASRPGLEGN